MKLKWIETENGGIIKVKAITCIYLRHYEKTSVIFANTTDSVTHTLKSYFHNKMYQDENNLPVEYKDAAELDYLVLYNCLVYGTVNAIHDIKIVFRKNDYMQEVKNEECGNILK